MDEERERLRAKRIQELLRGAQAPAPAGDVLVATDGNLPDLVRSNDGVLVDCYADWCAPCRIFAPVFAATAKEYAGRAAFAKLDTEANPQTAAAFRILSIPTLLVFRQGRLVTQQAGALPQPMLRAVVEAALRGAPPPKAQT